MGSAAGSLTDEQKAIYQSLVDESYDVFVDIVAKGRNMDIETVKQLADGRVYSAQQAFENGLVDKVEGWEDALAFMEEKTGVEMEALTAVSTAALTVYDMCKAVQKDMVITDIRLLSKTGGVHGDYKREE